MTTSNVVTDTTLGYVKRWGCSDFTSTLQAGESQQAVADFGLLDGGDPNYLKVVTGALADMTQGEKDAVDAALLPETKKAKCKKIDTKTKELLEAGVEYPASSGAYYKLTSDALEQFQLMIQADTYPFTWDSDDNLASITVADSTQANTFLNQAAGKVLTIQNGGSAVKDTVRACATKACVDAVVDPR